MKYAVIALKERDRSTGVQCHECLETFDTPEEAQDYMRNQYRNQIKSLCESGIKHGGGISDNGYTIYIESGYGAVTNTIKIFIKEI